MNLLLLAHLVADGGKAAETSSGPVWATWVTAIIGLLGSFIVAWWSGRKIDKQMELSKQATPPELTRYKEWLEVSEKYKGLVNFENVDALSIVSEEYREIEESRKASLERAVWERKVLSACPDIRAQKRILNIPHAMSTAKKIDFLALWPWFKSIPVKIVENIFVILMPVLIFVELIEYRWKPISMQSFFDDVLLVLIVGCISSIILSFCAAESGEIDAEYYFIRLRSAEAKVNEAETIDSFSMYIPNKRRLRLALIKREYRDWIYYPGFSLQGKPILCFFVPVVLFIFCLFPYWILCLISRCRYGSWKRYGSYRPEVFESGVENPVNEELSAQDESALGMESEESVELEPEGKN